MKYLLDNSNLAESYSGVTTPLTYSFVNHVYREVYKVFCKNMGVSKSVIRQHEEEFSNLLSFVGYSMYYNLQNWYTMLSFLPAYKINKQFFDRMLGVEADDRWEQAPVISPLRKYALELPRVVVQFVRIGFSFLFMGVLVKRFNKEFDGIFVKLESTNLQNLDPPALAKLYDEVSRKLLGRWWIPITNDFAVMVSAGASAKTLSRWLDQTDVASYLHLEARGSLISLDPGRSLMALVCAIKNDAAIYELFRQRLEPADLLHALSESYPESETYRLFGEYLAQYGARVPNELKLESETLNERPDLLVSLLQSLVHADGTETRMSRRQTDLPPGVHVRLNPAKRALLRWLLSWAGNSIRRREETRFRRTLIFGYARRLFLALGIQFRDTGLLANPRDIFYLTENEVLGVVKGSSDSQAIKALVARRKTELEEWKRLDLPRRIESDGPFEELLERLKSRTCENEHPEYSNRLKGTVVSRGACESVSGTALVLSDFSSGANYNDKVLVTRQTDPGWTIVFPFVKALIVERGGILSHAAIVARELGIPCIVGVENAATLIPDGAEVELLLGAGEISVRLNGIESSSAALQEEICVS